MLYYRGAEKNIGKKGLVLCCDLYVVVYGAQEKEGERRDDVRPRKKQRAPYSRRLRVPSRAEKSSRRTCGAKAGPA